MWEFLTWQLPWHQDAASHWAIVGIVGSGGRLETPSPEALPGPYHLAPETLEAYQQLMRQCWAQEPADRPTFATIAARIRCGGRPWRAPGCLLTMAATKCVCPAGLLSQPSPLPSVPGLDAGSCSGRCL